MVSNYESQLKKDTMDVKLLESEMGTHIYEFLFCLKMGIYIYIHKKMPKIKNYKVCKIS